MIIDKITFKENQAWIVFRTENGAYLGTWHCNNEDFVKWLRERNPKEVIFK